MNTLFILLAWLAIVLIAAHVCGFNHLDDDGAIDD